MVVPRMPQAAQVQAKRKTIPAMRLVTAPSPFGPPSMARRCFNVKYFVYQSYGGGAPAGRAGFPPSTSQPINQQSRRTPAPLGRYRGATDGLPWHYHCHVAGATWRMKLEERKSKLGRDGGERVSSARVSGFARKPLACPEGGARRGHA